MARRCIETSSCIANMPTTMLKYIKKKTEKDKWIILQIYFTKVKQRKVRQCYTSLHHAAIFLFWIFFCNFIQPVMCYLEWSWRFFKDYEKRRIKTYKKFLKSWICCSEEIRLQNWNQIYSEWKLDKLKLIKSKNSVSQSEPLFSIMCIGFIAFV